MREIEDWKSEQEKKNEEASFLLVESEYYQVSSHREQAVSSINFKFIIGCLACTVL